MNLLKRVGEILFIASGFPIGVGIIFVIVCIALSV